MLIESVLTTRGYELSHDGRIPPHALLRYMEELRWGLHLAPDEPRVIPSGHFAIVVAQRLTVLERIGVGVELAGTTVISHVGRTSLHFFHELKRREPDGAVAIGLVTVVNCDTDGKPQPLPSAVHALVRPPAPKRLSFPKPLTKGPSREAWTRRFEVRPCDLDLLRHVNHANYLTYIEDTLYLLAHQAQPTRPAGTFGDALQAPLRAVAIDYRAQAVAGQALVASLWPLGRSPLSLGFELRRELDSGLLCRARIELTS